MGCAGVKGRSPFIVSPRCVKVSDKWDFIKWGRGPAPDQPTRNRPAFIGITGPQLGAGARSAGRALRVHQQPLHSAGAPMLAPVLLHSAAGPLSAAASLPTPGPHRWQLLRATGRGPPPAGGGGGSRPALWAVPPAPSGLRAAPLPTLGGVPPPAPSIPLRGLAGVMWRPRPGPCGPRPGQVGRQPLHGGTPPQCKAKPLRGRSAGLALLLPRAGCGAGAPGRPGPHCMGAVGPSAPPAPPFGRA